MSKLFTRKTKTLIQIVFVAFMLCINVLPSFAQKQNKKELENKKKKLQEEIEYTNKLLNETRKNKKHSLSQLIALNKKISVRQELINTINNEIGELNGQIGKNNFTIKSLQIDLAKLKADYAKMIYYAYKNQDAYTKLMFVFAAKDFSQGFLRLKYFQQYNDYRRKQASLIEGTQQKIKIQTDELEQKKNEKNELLGSQENEKKSLVSEKSEKEQILGEFQNKEKQLKKELDKKKKDAEKLQLAIQRMIEDELKKAQAKAKVDGKPEPKTLALTPEAKELSNSFSSNKGKLPWPVIKGIIAEHFGEHPHPSMPSVLVKNNGIDIATSKGSLARAVFDGEVTYIGSIPSYGKIVMVRHGEFLSVYANLSEVYVGPGDKVKTKQNIGNIIYDEDDSKTQIHLEIWKGQTRLDPEEWLFVN